MKNLTGFVDYLERQERAENTIDTYVRGVKFFLSCYGEPTAESVMAYKKYLIATYKPKTVNLRLTGILNYAKYLGLNLSVNSLRIQKTLALDNVITPEEYNRLTDGLKYDGNERGYWIITVLAKTGARASEFLRFTKTGLRRGYEELFTKGKIRRIYYPANIAKEISPYSERVRGELLFPSLANNIKKEGAQMTTRGLAGLIKGYGRLYNIRKEVMHPHGFRHFFAKEFLRNGGDLTLLSDLLGHENLTTTAIYTRKSIDEMRKDISCLMGGNNNAVFVKSNSDNQIDLQTKLIFAQEYALQLSAKLFELTFRKETT